MARLPHRLPPLAYGVIQVAITMEVATAVAIHQSTGLTTVSLSRWVMSRLAALLVMLLVMILISPLVKRLVAVLTADEPR
jgi:hypothetical protein